MIVSDSNMTFLVLSKELRTGGQVIAFIMKEKNVSRQAAYQMIAKRADLNQRNFETHPFIIAMSFGSVVTLRCHPVTKLFVQHGRLFEKDTVVALIEESRVREPSKKIRRLRRQLVS